VFSPRIPATDASADSPVTGGLAMFDAPLS
jgi:hypothetical protein